KLVYSFVSHWGISADVKFSSEGETLGLDKDNKTVARANYIRVPLQGIYFFGKYGNKVRPKISVGPSFGFLVGGETKQYTNGDVTATVKTKDFAESFDLGLTGAVGLNVRVAKATWLNADVAYYHGLTDVATGGDAKNRNIGINVGVLFPLGTVK
ncbi:MAG: PorT family protein, partial [Chitinophagaceae bacterium]